MFVSSCILALLFFCCWLFETKQTLKRKKEKMGIFSTKSELRLFSCFKLQPGDGEPSPVLFLLWHVNVCLQWKSLIGPHVCQVARNSVYYQTCWLLQIISVVWPVCFHWKGQCNQMMKKKCFCFFVIISKASYICGAQNYFHMRNLDISQ